MRSSWLTPALLQLVHCGQMRRGSCLSNLLDRRNSVWHHGNALLGQPGCRKQLRLADCLVASSSPPSSLPDLISPCSMCRTPDLHFAEPRQSLRLSHGRVITAGAMAVELEDRTTAALSAATSSCRLPRLPQRQRFPQQRVPVVSFRAIASRTSVSLCSVTGKEPFAGTTAARAVHCECVRQLQWPERGADVAGADHARRGGEAFCVVRKEGCARDSSCHCWPVDGSTQPRGGRPRA